MKSKLCKACNIIKTIDHFFSNHQASDGLMARCKKCYKTGKTIYKKENPLEGNKSTFRHLSLNNVNKKDYLETYQALEKIGYDICGDIHAQFCEKYNLSVSIRTVKSRNSYYPKDLGLC